MQTNTRNREVDNLLDALYPYFNNPHYEWPDEDELNNSQKEVYNSVTTRLSQTKELIGVSAVIPQVKSLVEGWLKWRWNTNPWIGSIVVEVEKHGSSKLIK